MKKRTTIRNQKGFTLVEIAIVLVIIGLLIGGVLQGRSMIQNARVKRVVSDMEGLRTAVLTFQDRYGMLPGDENDANNPPGDTKNGNNNGQMAETAGWEMQDLRLAGLIPGSGTTLPAHQFGGTLRVGWANISGLTTNWIIATNLPGEVCQEIDTKYDDGVYNTGDIRGNAVYTTATIGTFGWRL